MEGYIPTLRKKIGSDLFIHPAARIIIENDQGQVLFIRRIDNGQWGIPAGAFEHGETIEECICREVKEETGLQILKLQLIGISTQPSLETVCYPNGDQVQYFTVEFYSKHFEGRLEANKVETISVSFQPKERRRSLPENEQSTFESLDHYQKTGNVLLK